MAEGVGDSILVKVVPIDPRDLLRGQYMRLGYEFSRLSGQWVRNQEVSPSSAIVWVVLHSEGKFHVPKEFRQQRPQNLGPEEVALCGHIEGGRITFGIESYFVPEGTETPNWNDLTVRLRVGEDGRPRIEQVYLSGVPWP